LKYQVQSSAEQRAELEGLTSKSQIEARKLKRALVLLAADDGDKDEDIAAKARVSKRTVAVCASALLSKPWARHLTSIGVPAKRDYWTGVRKRMS
jgi:DNA-binding NarL/FixJ family response regulator